MKKLLFLFLFTLSFFLFSCVEPELGEESVVYTGKAYDINETSASIKCVLNVEQYGAVLNLWVMFSTDKGEMERYNGKVVTTSNIRENEYIIHLQSLLPNTVYYYCAVVKVTATYNYGKIKTFRTKKSGEKKEWWEEKERKQGNHSNIFTLT